MKPTEDREHAERVDAARAPVNVTVSFEAEDVNSSAVERVGLALALTILLTLGVCAGVFYLLARQTVEGTPTIAPVLRSSQPELPPAPRMQGIPGDNILPPEQQQQFTQAAQRQLDSYGWVDQQNGIARIPIQEAMKIVAARGVAGAPAAAKNGFTAPSIANITPRATAKEPRKK